jgi:hypothetical protein
MERGVVVRGRLRGRLIELDEEVDDLDGEVEVVVRPAADATPRPPDVLDGDPLQGRHRSASGGRQGRLV